MTPKPSILNTLFGSREPFDCPDAADVNDSGFVDLSDAVALLNFLFSGTYVPPDPIWVIGPDPTPDALSCE